MESFWITGQEIAVLQAGDYFGEQSILTGKKRGATIVATEYLVCYRLHKSEFLALFKPDRIDVKFVHR